MGFGRHILVVCLGAHATPSWVPHTDTDTDTHTQRVSFLFFPSVLRSRPTGLQRRSTGAALGNIVDSRHDVCRRWSAWANTGVGRRSTVCPHGRVGSIGTQGVGPIQNCSMTVIGMFLAADERSRLELILHPFVAHVGGAAPLHRCYRSEAARVSRSSTPVAY